MLLHPWKLQLFGALELQRDGDRITRFPTEKVGLLLAYLAISSPLTRTREELIELFWPDSSPEAGRVSLRQALASLRRLLEPPNIVAGSVIAADRSHISFNAGSVQTDLGLWDRLLVLVDQTKTPLQKIEKLREAVARYSGPFLPGAYMDWALTEREYRQDQFVGVLLNLSDLEAQCGDLDGAIATAQLLLRTDPLHEEAHGRLMQLFARLGKTSVARQQYLTFARLLREQLDIDPGDEVQQLYSNLNKIAPQTLDLARFIEPPAFQAAPTVVMPANEPDRAARLPLRLTRFFGREHELRQVSVWLNDREVRLVTVTGIGGVGKTRLALQAAEQQSRFACSITFVPLSDTQDPSQLLPAILYSMGMPAGASADPLARLTAVLRGQAHLLVLDNFEQIADLAAEALWRLLESISCVTCLVTSRQALNLPGEHELSLTPLPVPHANLLAEDLISNPTVQMLVDRMRARRPDFQVTPANAGAVASLCDRLEGIPLAVELAAGWARDLTINQMRERLDSRFDLLVSRQHGVHPRHRSLRAAVESSWQMLNAPLQLFFAKLCVFRGGWRSDMAKIAWPGDDSSVASIADSLRTLREHSLITAQEVGDTVRYGMLETLRAFGKEMLTADQCREIEAKHAVWMLAFALDTTSKLHGRDQAMWLDRIEEEQDNIRGALDFGARYNPVLGLRLCNALYWFWYVRSCYSEGEQWLAALLDSALDAPNHDRAWALIASGHLANCQSNNHLAVSRYAAAKALFEEIGDARGIAHAVTRLGNAAQELRDVKSGHQLCGEAVALFRELDDPSGLLLALFYLLNTLLEVDNPEEGEACFAEAYALAESVGDLRFKSLLQFCFSNFRRRSGDIPGAVDSCRQALELQRLLREPLSVSYLLRDLSSIVASMGNSELAVTLYGAMRGLRRRIGYPLGQHEAESTRILETQLYTNTPAFENSDAFHAGFDMDFDACLTLASKAIEGSSVVK